MRSLVPILTALMTAWSLAAGAPAPAGPAGDLWAPLQFLVGGWSGTGSGQPGEVLTGTTSFSFELGKKILVRKNRAESAPKPGEKTGDRTGDKTGAVHEDLLIIYEQPGESRLRAIYFDNEGHAINYRVLSSGKPNKAVFESAGSGKTPRFRLTYELNQDGAMTTEFSMAPPGGDFKPYTTGKVKRVP